MVLHAAVVDEWTPELLAQAPRHASELERFAMLPHVFVGDTDAEGAQRLSRLAGVRTVRAILSSRRNILAALDELVTIAVAHAREVATNGIANAATAWFDDGVPKMPTLAVAAGVPVWGVDAVVRIPTRLCSVGAINISVETRTPFVYDPDDPVVVALTDAASALPIVFAAGNIHRRGDDRRMFGWVVAPSVVSVAAVDRSGRPFWNSRIGDPDDDHVRPTVAALGDDETGDAGTSYAAPVVATELTVLSVAMYLLRAVTLRLLHGAWREGVPIGGRCFIDIDSLPGTVGHGAKVHDFAVRSLPLPALPLIDVDDVALRVLVSSAEATEAIVGLPSPTTLRTLLIASAVRGDADPLTVGAGVVSARHTDDFVSGWTPRRLAGVLGWRIDDEAPAADAALFQRDLVAAWLHGARSSMIGWAKDLALFGTDPTPVFVEKVPHVPGAPAPPH